MYKVMTPGPTMVAENVRMARSEVMTNPDVDPDFTEMYHSVCMNLAKLLNCSGNVYILGGEGILSLEAACATLTEQGDRVLVIDNGIFGKGFADFVKIYGGNPVLFTTDYHKPVDLEDLKDFLEKDHNFKYATVVHCDTPSGVLNDISKICPILKQYGILSVVDSVAGMFGEKVDVDNWKLDVVCGGSQKALSAPPGLAFVFVSKDAMNAMENRKTPVASFYCNLLTFRTYYEDKWFPYTMPISDINGLRVAVENVMKDPDIYKRHAELAARVRNAVLASGLELYLTDGFASTVTAVRVPKETTDVAILNYMKEKHNILIAGCFDVLAGKLIRIGHMGNNAREKDVQETLLALDDTLRHLGVPLKQKLSI